MSRLRAPDGRRRAGAKLALAPRLLLLVALLGMLGGAVLAEAYLTRGVAIGDERPPIPHTDVNPLGINTHLQDEADPAKVERSLDMIAAAGFTYIRQPFPWNDLESQPDRYWDSRHNVSSWAKYDRIVELAAARKLEIVARLDKPPAWARAGQPNLERIPDGRPNRDADYADFVADVVGRYRGRIRYIQIWNEPNLEGEWGGQPIDPAAFTELLKAAYTAAKRVDPAVVVLAPGLAPTDQTGPTNLSDLLFLQGMYDAGAREYFDIASVMVYGYGYSPYDRRVEFARNNFSRPIQTREIMERNGDAAKPVWAVEYAWLAFPEDWTGRASIWGRPVSEAQQAEYLYEGYRRAQQEWPWMGAMCIWTFRWIWPPDDPNEAVNPTRAFAIVNYDFTPRPAYTLLARSRDALDRAYTGAYTADSRLIQADEGWALRREDGRARLQPRRAGARLRIPFAGTRLDLVLSGAGSGYTVWVDGRRAAEVPADRPGRVVVVDGFDDGPHLIEVVAEGAGEGALTIDGFIVLRQPLGLRLLPWLKVGLSAAGALLLISSAWRKRQAG